VQRVMVYGSDTSATKIYDVRRQVRTESNGEMERLTSATDEKRTLN
jgi:hypothetical protein